MSANLRPRSATANKELGGWVDGWMGGSLQHVESFACFLFFLKRANSTIRPLYILILNPYFDRLVES